MTGIFAVLDDIAMLMDDTAVMAKVAAKKTAGVLGDDLAVGAEKASKFHASREIPVLWKITKGSFLNKLIILPFAFILSYFAPYLIVPILLFGGVYLSYEGVEKIIHILRHRNDNKLEEENEIKTEEEILSEESAKIKSAVMTDFILSIEIVMIALGTVTDKPFMLQVVVVSVIAILATVGVYGLVALMVRMDDVGLKMVEVGEKSSSILNTILVTSGNGLIKLLPILIKTLAFVGTVAMLLVGGGMFVHNIHYIHEIVSSIPSIFGELLIGLNVGVIAFFSIEIFNVLKNKISK